MCRTLVRDDFLLYCSEILALRAASQSKTDVRPERALHGDSALMGESRLERAGLAGSIWLGKVVGPVGGADMGGAREA